MFNIGFSELLLILLVAFVFVGPKDLPKVARALGRGVRWVKQFIKDVQDETGLGEAVNEFKKTSRELEQTFRSADPTAELKQAQKEIETAVEDTVKTAQDALSLKETK
ncbi:MAG: twin-arginine translocase subunit TatB [Clostridia bacterium]|nr:twin-arginine translocase subunit TatB [Clostridia bacterium]